MAEQKTKSDFSLLSVEEKKARKQQHWLKRQREIDTNFPKTLMARLKNLTDMKANELEIGKKVELLEAERQWIDLCPKTNHPNSSKFSQQVVDVIIGKPMGEIKGQTEFEKIWEEARKHIPDWPKFREALSPLKFSEAKIEDSWAAALTRISFWQGFRHLYECAMCLGKDDGEIILLLKKLMMSYTAEIVDYLKANGQADLDQRFSAELVMTSELKTKQAGIVSKRTDLSSLTVGQLKSCDLALNYERGDFSRIQLLAFSVGHHICFLDMGSVLWFELCLPSESIKTCWDQRLQIVDLHEHPEIRVELASMNVSDCQVLITPDDSAALM
jgi:hypothetical protein